MCPIDPVTLDIITGTKRPSVWRRWPRVWRCLAYLIGPLLASINFVWYKVVRGEIEGCRSYCMIVVVQVAIMILGTWLRMSEEDREEIHTDRLELFSLDTWAMWDLVLGASGQARWARWARQAVGLGVVLLGIVIWREGWRVFWGWWW